MLREITKENAREMQKRSAAARRANKARRRALREILEEELAKPISKDSKITKAEWLVIKMIQNVKDEIRPQDVKTLQEILGEAVDRHEVIKKNTEVIEAVSDFFSK